MEHTQRIKTARITGIWYLILAISGVLGFLVFHPRVFVDSDPRKTLENLTGPGSLAGIRLFMELLIIVSQALAAAWFYKLFRDTDPWAASTIGIWGTVNSVAIMVSAIAMSTAIALAGSSTLSLENKEILIPILVGLMSNAWNIGGLFFGLWLLPMGYIIIRSRCMPIWLGRTLIIGGIGYILQTFIKSLGIESPYLGALTVPASIGEFWMIGYLLTYGIRHTDK